MRPMTQVVGQIDVSHDLVVSGLIIYMICHLHSLCFNVTNAKSMLCKDLTEGC